MRVLVLAAERRVAAAIRVRLRQEGWAVDVIDTLSGAQRLRADVDYDLLVLDRDAPGGDALEWLIEMRRAGDVVPAVLMADDNSPEERLRAFTSEADDYLAKPVDPVEVALRVRRASARVPAIPPDVPPREVIGPLSISRGLKEVDIDGRPVRLSATQYCLVEFLLSNRHRVVTAEELRGHCWDRNLPSSSDPLPAQLTRVRHALAGTVHLHSPDFARYQVLIRGIDYDSEADLLDKTEGRRPSRAGGRPKGSSRRRAEPGGEAGDRSDEKSSSEG